jgi:hypothetical protein
MHHPADNKADLTGSYMFPPLAPPLMDPLRLEVSDNHDNQPAMGATKTGGGWQEGIDKATTRP